MPAAKEFTFPAIIIGLLSMITGVAFGWLAGIVQYGARIEKYDARVQVLETQAPKVDAIYNALIRLGVVEISALAKSGGEK